MKRFTLALLTLTSQTLLADTVTRPDSHAPIGVMGDHTHAAGEWMFSYRYMRMTMDGMRDGTDNLSSAQVLQDFMVTPTEMDMDMHMFGLMYAPTDRVTLMAMLPYVSSEMDHVTRMGGRFTTEASGIGDLKLGGLVRLKTWEEGQLHLNLTLSTPIGEYKERDDTPAMANAILPYPMQPGSGTFDLISELTFVNYFDRSSIGLQGTYTYRIGDNDFDYTLGDRLDLNFWSAYQFCQSFSGSVRLAASDVDRIDGANPNLNPNMVPTADPNNFGGEQVNLLLGLNYLHNASGHRLALEFGKPVYQDLNGPQMRTNWIATVGWQKAF